MMLLQSLSIVFVIAAVVVSVAASSPSSPRSSNSMNHDQECTNNQGNTCSSSSSSSSSSYTTRPPRRVTVYQPICNYYLAPSSIPNSGFGTYTIRDIPQNTLLMQQADAPTIVLSDAARHDQLNTDLQQRDPTKMVQPLPVHYNYFWDGSGFADFEVDGRVEISVTTFGAMANYHPFLFNLYPTVEELDDSIVPRSSGSPGIGAFSYNMGYNYVSSRTIQKGEELFTTYGETWLDIRSYCDKVPRQNDYFIGARVIEKMILAGISSQNIRDKIIASTKQIVSLFEERAAESLPASLEDFVDVLNQFTNKSSSELSDKYPIAMALAKKSLIPRSVEWIKSQGQCLDHLVPDASTLKDAGRGAFAQRFIPKGSIVVPAPVIQIAEASELNMYNLDTHERIGTQLLMNYCFAHPNTTLLFCPQTNAIVINHCSSRNLTFYGGDCERYNLNQDETQRGPNAFVRWATSWDPETEKYLKVPLNDILDKTREGMRVLSMEIIALRDIHPGDEVFIDYGLEWEKAWVHHEQTWIPPSSMSYVPVKEMNDNVVDLKTPEELELDPYPENIRLGCRYSDNIDEFGDDNEDEDIEIDDARIWITADDRFLQSLGQGLFWPCSVTERIKSGPEGIYSVEIYQSPSMERTKWDERGIRRIIERFPRQSMIFRPQSKSSDHYVHGVFRQPLGLPDDMIVKQWIA